MEYILNPRRLRGSDFLMRWSQGQWSEERIVQAVNDTSRYFALPYGPSGTAPDGDVRAFELYFERLEKGVFAPILWNWITRHYRLEAVVTFDAEASPFPGVDTNALVFMIRRSAPKGNFLWARCTQRGTEELKKWTFSGFRYQPKGGLVVHRRELAEGLRTGLSRPPLKGGLAGPSLLDFATVVRGIATGANEFFFLTREQAQILGIPDAFLVPAIGRTRDVPADAIDKQLLEKLEASGRPTLLFCPDARRLDRFPEPVRRYLEEGERQGLPERPLIASRQPWYKMEVRKAPPILFAYLGRRNARFVRNLAGMMPLTGFLCVYPRSEDRGFIEKLWSVLNHPATVRNLLLVGKSYGSGCIKVEPRALKRLPLPEDAVRKVGLGTPLQFAQGTLPLQWATGHDG